jgi:hypothetical protein
MPLAIMLGRRWQRFLPLPGRVHRHGPGGRLPQ